MRSKSLDGRIAQEKLEPSSHGSRHQEILSRPAGMVMRVLFAMFESFSQTLNWLCGVIVFAHFEFL
jgi:hypothetical protein